MNAAKPTPAAGGNPAKPGSATAPTKPLAKPVASWIAGWVLAPGLACLALFIWGMHCGAASPDAAPQSWILALGRWLWGLP